ncbi:response regulator [Paenibacillus sp. NPDC058071]|uniref:response regulator transcription factor n=1 Tax=Paenibacillus sp. NPDC058071 TaxID=3346326 RepID=UPI0036DE09B8
MYRALIVDDESWVIESLKDLIDWGQYGFEVVGQATSGGEALDVIRERQPDVVFTDIRMPEMNGLELIRRGKSLDRPIRFVVVSGYAEFAYAQKALSYGAVAYCLKPFDEMEIAGVLLKLKGMLDGGAKPDKEQLLQRLLDEPEGERQERLLKTLGEAGVLDWIRKGIVPVVALGSEKLPLPESGIVRLVTGTAKAAYMMSREQAESMLPVWRSALPEGLSGIGIGSETMEWQALTNALQEADTAAYQSFVSGTTGVSRLRNAGEGELNGRLAVLRAAAEGKDGKGVKESLVQIGELFAAGELNIRHAFKVYNLTASLLYDLERKETILYGYEQLVRTFADIFAMLEELSRMADASLSQQQAFPVTESRNQAFNPILQYVTENFASDLSLQQLSSRFFLNPSYISQLFKKETGETLTAYVARLRIDHACELLVRSDANVQEIAEQIGYRDYFYFTRLFKKLTAQTPTQYREGHTPE